MNNSTIVEYRLPKEPVPLTQEELAEIEEASRHPINFDDIPEQTPEQLKQFKRVHPRRQPIIA